ncbi:MAG: hypothetical protein Q6M04_12230, partial [Thermostichus sp. BF3_bins_97]
KRGVCAATCVVGCPQVRPNVRPVAKRADDSFFMGKGSISVSPWCNNALSEGSNAYQSSFLYIS